ncbi:hypothetical protein EB796_007378 [Bugula neritina]|uniref:Uncharacterized protein n=1 Tax=Bugula neritina TaxID=10212 RepID=A0A7J7K7Z5_BUGNE|nr:hypothetical protein EB796_007378 [Bugula neritina]
MQLNKTQETPLDSDIAKLVDFMDKEIVILTVLPYNYLKTLYTARIHLVQHFWNTIRYKNEAQAEQML